MICCDRTVRPEDSICGRGLILGVRLEDLFTVRTFQGLEFVGVQTGMPRIARAAPSAFRTAFNRFARPRFGESFELAFASARKLQLEQGH